MTPLFEILSRVLSAVAAVLGAAGYVYVLGAAVLWVRLRNADLPTEVPLAMASREELITIGAQTLVMWLVLAALLCLVLASVLRRAWAGPAAVFSDAVLGLAIAFAVLVGLVEGRNELLVLAVVAAGIVVFGAALYGPGEIRVWQSVSWVLGGALSGLAVARLSDAKELDTLVIAWAATLAFLLVALALRDPWRRREDTVAALIALETRIARLDQEIAGGQLPGQAQSLRRLRAGLENVTHQVRRRFGIPAAVATRPLWVWWRWAAFVVLGLLVLGGVSVASQTAAHEDFDRAVVGRTDGTCVAGAYIVRSDDRLVLAQIGSSRDARVVSIPNAEIRELQVGGPHEVPAELDTACAGEIATQPPAN